MPKRVLLSTKAVGAVFGCYSTVAYSGTNTLRTHAAVVFGAEHKYSLVEGGGGLVMYDHQIQAYHCSSFMAKGDFDYEAMRDENPELAALYFWSFVILGSFLLLNFIIAVIAEAFAEETGKTQTEGIASKLEKSWRTFRRNLNRHDCMGSLKNLFRSSNHDTVIHRALLEYRFDLVEVCVRGQCVCVCARACGCVGGGGGGEGEGNVLGERGGAWGMEVVEGGSLMLPPNPRTPCHTPIRTPLTPLLCPMPTAPAKPRHKICTHVLQCGSLFGRCPERTPANICGPPPSRDVNYPSSTMKGGVGESHFTPQHQWGLGAWGGRVPTPPSVVGHRFLSAPSAQIFVVSPARVLLSCHECGGCLCPCVVCCA